MRRSIALLASFLLTSTALADPPTTESIRTLLSASRTERVTDAMFASMDRTMQQAMDTALAGRPRAPEQQRASELARAKVAAILRDELAWSKLEPIYIEIYRETYTQDEIDGLIAFYRSPTGVAFVDKLPIVLQKSSIAMQSRMGPIMQRIQEATQQAADEARSAPPAPVPAAH